MWADGMSFARIAGQRRLQRRWPRGNSVVSTIKKCTRDDGAGTMTKKRGDDQHGYDPERAAARSLLDRLERQAEQRPDKPAQEAGRRAQGAARSRPTTKRLIDAHAEIIDGPAGRRSRISHSVLCQTSLPYKPTDERGLDTRPRAASPS